MLNIPQNWVSILYILLGLSVFLPSTVCIVGRVIRTDCRTDFGDMLRITGYCIVASICVSMLGGLGTTLVLSADDSNYIYATGEPTELHALSDNRGTTGTFFLGTGSVGSEARYYCIAQGEFGMQMLNIPAEECYLNYTEEAPTATQLTPEYKDSSLLKWAFSPTLTRGVKWVLEIPEGSITNEFRIDLN